MTGRDLHASLAGPRGPPGRPPAAAGAASGACTSNGFGDSDCRGRTARAQSRSQAYLLRLQCHVGARPGLVGLARRRVVDSRSESTWILNRDLTVRILNSDLTVVGLVEAVLIENIKWLYT